MIARRVALAAGAGLVLALAACGEPTKDEIIEKARGVRTRAALEKKLGRPADIQKLGPVEMWTYKTKTGDVIFVITGERVALQAAE
ncbi:MAG: hypothetical protein FJX51_08680 [Alphaproteobacteria bacterium]|nr:hypothetical protein [Alphaproteobacteria bacterium]